MASTVIGQALHCTYVFVFDFALEKYYLQEAKESFASSDYLFYGKSHTVKQLGIKMAAKSPFCLPSILLPEAMDQSGTRSD